MFNKHRKTANRRQFWGIPNCPKCCSTIGFKFHFNPPKHLQHYPNECKNCHCFCNVFGEVYTEK